MILPLIAIDGPAGVGKTSTACTVASRLGIPFLDTGAMYRAVTWVVTKNGVNVTDVNGINRLIARTQFEFAQGLRGVHFWVNGEEITDQLRTPEITRAVTPVCEVHDVRVYLVNLQRKWVARGFGVMEGRDIGTVVLPKAELKIFMTAKPEIRALRRAKELGIADDEKAVAKLSKEIAERDRRDMEREDSPLRQANDAITLDNTEMSFDEQVNKVILMAAEQFSLNLYTAVRPVG
ncbi:MAG: (d)CMP kinase [Calditrichaeota bacterium]|nr:(d)CMP kinase [Calditrichota bacterium]